MLEGNVVKRLNIRDRSIWQRQPSHYVEIHYIVPVHEHELAPLGSVQFVTQPILRLFRNFSAADDESMVNKYRLPSH